MYQRIQLALEILLELDKFLLENDVHERTIAHRLAIYLEWLFPKWHIDCEYNLHGIHIKELPDIRDCDVDKKTDRVLPDIIIHKRNSDKNLLVIEIKKDKESACDIKKLELFTKENGKYKYRLGLFIKFNKTNKPLLIWFKDGRKICIK